MYVLTHTRARGTHTHMTQLFGCVAIECAAAPIMLRQSGLGSGVISYYVTMTASQGSVRPIWPVCTRNHVVVIYVVIAAMVVAACMLNRHSGF